MPIAVWKERNMACPTCSKPVRRGLRRFGPAKVRCEICDEEFDTGLRDLYGIPKIGRVIYIIFEWIYPSYIRGFDQPAKSLMLFYHLFFIGLAPITIPSLIWFIVFQKNLELFIPTGLLFGACLLQVLWLYRMVSEAKNYHDKGIVPVWRGPFESKPRLNNRRDYKYVTKCLKKFANPNVLATIISGNKYSKIIREVRYRNHLILALKDQDVEVRRQAAMWLVEVPNKNVIIDPLIEALKDSDGTVRARAASSLCYIGNPCALENLQALLNDPDENVRKEAGNAATILMGESENSEKRR